MTNKPSKKKFFFALRTKAVSSFLQKNTPLCGNFSNLKVWTSLIKHHLTNTLKTLTITTLEDIRESVLHPEKKIGKYLASLSSASEKETSGSTNFFCNDYLDLTSVYHILEHKGDLKGSKRWNIKKPNGDLLEPTPLPLMNSVDGMKLIRGPSDPILSQFNLDIKNKSEQSSIFLWLKRKESNVRCNHYLRHSYDRLRDYRDRNLTDKYWEFYFNLILRSDAFFVANLSNWNELWYKEMDILELVTMRNQIINFASNRSLDQEQLQNVWIESPKGKWRCLSVPGKAMRLYSHILNNGLVFLLRKDIIEGNHGFINARGCTSAWKEIISSNLLESDTILQLDVSSGFPNLHKGYVAKYLESSGKLPISLINHILTLLTLPIIETDCPSPEAILEQAHNKAWKEGPRGLPMGLGISPFLYVYTVTNILKSTGLWTQFKWINYADDLNIFIDNWNLKDLQKIFKVERIEISNLFNLLNNLALFRKAGLQFNEEKFSICKKNGVWQQSLKLLGLRFDGKNLFAGTRGRGANPIKKKKATEPQTMLLEISSRKTPEILNFPWLSKNVDRYWSLFQSYLYNGGKLKFHQRWLRPSKKNSLECLIRTLAPKHLLKKEWISKTNMQNISQTLMLIFLRSLTPTPAPNDTILNLLFVFNFFFPSSQPLSIPTAPSGNLDWLKSEEKKIFTWDLEETGAYFIKYSELKKRNLIGTEDPPPKPNQQ